MKVNGERLRLPDSHELLAEARAFGAKKRLGQNFLIDPDRLARIAGALAIAPGDIVLEIGPGLGFLTRTLAASRAQVTAVELDQAAVAHLQALALPGVQVVHGDFLAFDVGQLGGRVKVVGNVPYQITSRILCHLLGEIDEPSPWLAAIERVVMTVQLEVAERFVASPGGKDYSQISLLAQYYSKPSLLEKVPAGSFFPAPAVTSAVVMFEPLPAPAVACVNRRLLRQVIQAGFSQRRKMLRNNLGFLHLSPGELDRVFAQLRLDPQARAERLSLTQFALLTDALHEVVK